MAKKERVGLSEAAAIFGVSIPAMRKRVTRGSVDAVKDQDGKWQIHITDRDLKKYGVDPTRTRTDSRQVQDTNENSLLYEALIKQLEEKDRQIEKLQMLIENTQVLHKNEQQRILLLDTKKSGSFLNRIFKKEDPGNTQR